MRRLVVLTLLLTGCGSSPTAAPPVTSPPRPSAAKVTVGAENVSLTISDRAGDFVCGKAHAEWHFVESAGLGARLTHSDVYLLEKDGDVTERVVADRSDRIESNGQLRLNYDRVAACGFEGREYPPTAKGLFTVVDDAGNTLSLTAEAVLIEK